MTLAVEPYLIEGVETLLTPSLAIYPDIVDRNIECTLRLLAGDANRWRPHLKTAKLGFIMQCLVERGVVQAKCSTTLELVGACEAGMKDVLLAYPVVGANANRVRELAEDYSDVQVSVLVENPTQADAWSGSRVGIFIDVNPGMDRTGIAQERIPAILGLARAIDAAGLEFRGLHYYDGHVAALSLEEREAMAHRGYDRLMEIVAAIEADGSRVREVITSGTPAFPCAASYGPFRSDSFIHRVSPGTVVYSDATSLTQMPAEWGFQPAAVVISTVVSHPRTNYITCDAGHKSVSADAGVPTCVVAGRPDLRPLKPSEEHLPMEVQNGGSRPQIGDPLYLIPRHVCPTVNNFSDAVLVKDRRVVGVALVTARGHETPIPATLTARARNNP